MMSLREQYENFKPHTIGEIWAASKARDAVCDEFVEEARKIYKEDSRTLVGIELLAEEMKKRNNVI